jgi:SulP family sulfate permease
MGKEDPSDLVLPHYSWTGLRCDLVAGLTVAAVAVPQAMAYALIAGVDPRYGLYTAIVMTALGSVFGSSAHLINGPTNAISLVVFSAVANLGLPAEARTEATQAVFLLALLVGGFQVLIALLKLGDLTRYVSESVILGFMVGAGLLVALSQMPNLFGLATQGDGHQHLLYRLWLSLADADTINPFALILGLVTILLVVLVRRLGDHFRVPLPDMLIGLIVAALVAAWYHQKETWPDLPASLPAFAPPHVHPSWVRQLAGSALAIALLGLLEALAIAKSIASQTRQPLDYNRQCLAEGLANLGGGLFQCMPGSGSLTRSAINFQAGAVSRLSGILAAVAVAAAVLVFAPLAQYVPRPALAGILLVTAWRLVDWKRFWYCLRATRFDAGIALSTAFAAVFVSIEFSILIGTFLSFLFFVPRAARLQASELILSAERVVRERRPDDPECGKLVVFSLEGELFFGAAPEFDDYLTDLKRRTEQGVRVIVLRLKRARNPDMVCLERLELFLREMKARKVVVLLCGVRPDFAQIMTNLRFQHWMEPNCIFLEDVAVMSSTLKAVRRAYELLGEDLCSTCPRRQEREAEKGDWYYMI